MAVEWISLKEAADILGVSESTVYRAVSDPAHPQHDQWGGENVGWRRKPMTRRGDFQVSKAKARELAGLPAES